MTVEGWKGVEYLEVMMVVQCPVSYSYLVETDCHELSVEE
jgi:hypothetical protein